MILRVAMLAAAGVFAGLSMVAATCFFAVLLSGTAYPAGYGVTWLVLSLLAACGSLACWDEYLERGAR